MAVLEALHDAHLRVLCRILRKGPNDSLCDLTAEASALHKAMYRIKDDPGSDCVYCGHKLKSQRLSFDLIIFFLYYERRSTVCLRCFYK